ncbi:MAG TPA: hypothetical protein VJ183_19700 [Chloroflexia bacterium]|nr:hypothetical protein [Chloroflexia bacterium]
MRIKNTRVDPQGIWAVTMEDLETGQKATDYYTSRDFLVFVDTESPSGKRDRIGTVGVGRSEVTGRIQTDDKTERGLWKIIFTGYPTGVEAALGHYKILAP